MSNGKFRRKKNENSGKCVENKKVKNAEKVVYDGILFLSRTEGKCYLILKNSCLSFKHEPEKITIWKGERTDNVFVYEKRRKIFSLYKAVKPQDTTYTPDFVVYSHDGKKKVYIEVKGKQNDLFSTKRKMFYTWMHNEMESNKDIELRYAFVKNLTEMTTVVKTLSEDADFGKAVEMNLF